MPQIAGALLQASKPASPSGLCRLRDSWAHRLLVASVFLSVGIGVGVGLTGCVTYLPLDEYNIARAAMEGARDKEAMKFAPNLWFKAEQAYREGEASYRDRRYDKARVMFEQARKLAEEAENAAHLSRFESGEIAP